MKVEGITLNRKDFTKKTGLQSIGYKICGTIKG